MSTKVRVASFVSSKMICFPCYIHQEMPPDGSRATNYLYGGMGISANVIEEVVYTGNVLAGYAQNLVGN